MGFFHVQHAYAARAGGPGAKAVLVCIADRACDVCGLAWPGVAYIAERTEIPERRVSVHLKTLLDAGLIAVHGYSTGGRGRTTEYVAIPSVAKLSTAPCQKCAQLGKTLSLRAGFRGRNPVATSTGNPVATSTPSVSIDQSVDQSAKPREETRPQPPGRSEASSRAASHPKPLPGTEARSILEALGLKPSTAAAQRAKAQNPDSDPPKPHTGQPGGLDTDSGGAP